MLINFSVENWISFRDKATFSMVGSLEKQHSERIPYLEKYKSKVLPVAAIYGANASGKTNFFQAINFVKHFVVKGTMPGWTIPVKPFLLGSDSTPKETTFTLDILIDEQIYNYSFSTTHKKILEEKLVQINASSEKILYHRKDGDPNPNLHQSITDQEFLNFAFKGTRENMLFLTNSISQNITAFKPIYNWFNECLELIAPDSRFEPFEQFIDENNKMYEVMNNILPLLDTGISRICGDIIPVEDLGNDIVMQLDSQLKEGMTVRIIAGKFGRLEDRIIVTKKAGKLIAKKLVTMHIREDGKEIKFDVNQESNGSKRIIDILPAFLSAAADNSQRVCIIDEVEMSLHPSLTRKLFEYFLYSCSSDTRAQILFTTHDLQLMDQDILRRDEIWITERSRNGVSRLRSFSEFKDVRKDKDIRKSYLDGRMGGIPSVTIVGNDISDRKFM